MQDMAFKIKYHFDFRISEGPFYKLIFRLKWVFAFKKQFFISRLSNSLVLTWVPGYRLRHDVISVAEVECFEEGVTNTGGFHQVEVGLGSKFPQI